MLGEWCQNGMKYGHLTAEDLPYKPLYFRPGSLRLAPGSKYSDLIGAMSVYGFKPEARNDWSPVLGLSDVVATKQTLMRNSDSRRYIVFFKD